MVEQLVLVLRGEEAHRIRQRVRLLRLAAVAAAGEQHVRGGLAVDGRHLRLARREDFALRIKKLSPVIPYAPLLGLETGTAQLGQIDGVRRGRAGQLENETPRLAGLQVRTVKHNARIGVGPDADFLRRKRPVIRFAQRGELCLRTRRVDHLQPLASLVAAPQLVAAEPVAPRGVERRSAFATEPAARLHARPDFRAHRVRADVPHLEPCENRCIVVVRVAGKRRAEERPAVVADAIPPFVLHDRHVVHESPLTARERLAFVAEEQRQLVLAGEDSPLRRHLDAGPRRLQRHPDTRHGMHEIAPRLRRIVNPRQDRKRSHRKHKTDQILFHLVISFVFQALACSLKARCHVQRQICDPVRDDNIFRM